MSRFFGGRLTDLKSSRSRARSAVKVSWRSRLALAKSSSRDKVDAKHELSTCKEISLRFSGQSPKASVQRAIQWFRKDEISFTISEVLTSPVDETMESANDEGGRGDGGSDDGFDISFLL